MWDRALAETRARFDPRRPAAHGRWGVAPPDWLTDGDPLRAAYDHQARLFERGRVVWARFVKANRALFAGETCGCPVPHPCGAVLIHGGEAGPDALAEVGTRLRALRAADDTPDDPDARELVDILRDDQGRTTRWPLPASVVGRDDLLLTDTVVHREHIPDGVLSGLATVPFLLDPDAGVGLVLPWEYWPPAVLRLWDEAPLPPTVQRAPRPRRDLGAT